MQNLTSSLVIPAITKSIAYTNTISNGSLYTVSDEVVKTILMGDATIGGVKIWPFANIITPEMFGGYGNGVADDTLAISKAVLEAEQTGKTLYIPNGEWVITGDIVIKKSISIKGSGYNSHLIFTNGGLKLDASVNLAHIQNWSIESLSITRKGLAGPALALFGHDLPGQNYGVIRGSLENITIRASTGNGIDARNAYMLDFGRISVFNCNGIGICFDYGNNLTTSVNSANVRIREVKGCNQAIYMRGVSSVSFTLGAIQGNNSGIYVGENSRSVSLEKGYFELNGGYDIFIGDAFKSSPVMVTLENLEMFDGPDTNSKGNKAFSINLLKCSGLSAENIRHSGYGVACFNYIPELGKQVVFGSIRNIYGHGSTAIYPSPPINTVKVQ